MMNFRYNKIKPSTASQAAVAAAENYEHIKMPHYNKRTDCYRQRQILFMYVLVVDMFNICIEYMKKMANRMNEKEEELAG